MSGFALRSSFSKFASHRTGVVAGARLGRVGLFRCNDSIRPLCRCSRGLTRHGPRVVDIELDDLAGEGCCGHQGHALRRLKAVPSTLGINRNQPGAESEGLGWSVVADDFQSRSTVEKVDQFVTSEMGFPMTFPGKLRNVKAAIAVRRQWSRTPLSMRHLRLRSPSTEHRQLRELGIEIDDAGCSAWHHSLWFRHPRIVDIKRRNGVATRNARLA